MIGICGNVAVMVLAFRSGMGRRQAAVPARDPRSPAPGSFTHTIHTLVPVKYMYGPERPFTRRSADCPWDARAVQPVPLPRRGPCASVRAVPRIGGRHRPAAALLSRSQTEGCRSGRTGRSRIPLYACAYRGFESHPLRQIFDMFQTLGVRPGKWKKPRTLPPDAVLQTFCKHAALPSVGLELDPRVFNVRWRG